MKPFRSTVTGSYPRPVQPGDTLKKPTLSRAEADETIRWAVRDQAALGLDIVTDGEGRRENMYYFFQKRLDGISFDEMEYRKYGPLGFGIEIAKVTGNWEDREGQYRRCHFAVLTETNNYFEMRFHLKDFSWILSKTSIDA